MCVYVINRWFYTVRTLQVLFSQHGIRSGKSSYSSTDQGIKSGKSESSSAVKRL